jgi:hypothetical protein
VSLGLLRGLAARALGVDTPLRSQRVHSGGQPAEPDFAGEPAPWAALPQADAGRPPSPPPHAPSDREEPRTAALEASTPAHPLTAAQRLEKSPQGDHVERANSARTAPAAAHSRPATTQVPSRAATDAAAATTPVQREAQSSPQHAAVTPATPIAPMARTVQHAVPAPLLPLSAPPALPPPVAVNASSPERRDGRHRHGAAQAPTEVHVSIGRVELTALAPTTAARAPARREGPAGHSLAEYLRGPGAKRQS